jgi:hypothetical protein
MLAYPEHAVPFGLPVLVVVYVVVLLLGTVVVVVLELS